MEKQRLDRFISNQLNIARSDAKKLIGAGSVTVDGCVIKQTGYSVDVTKCEVCYKSNPIKYKKYIYILMNKPAGVLSASNDKSRKTILDLVPEGIRRNGLFPVGRLDRDTTGLILITDNGDFAHNCISPKKKVEKVYIAELDGDITDEMKEKFAFGITLVDGTVCKSAELKRVSENVAELTLTEGRYHQVKRMFGTVGLGVNKLRRVSIGHLAIPEGLKEGECIEIDEETAFSALKIK